MIPVTVAYIELTFQQTVVTETEKHRKPQLQKQTNKTKLETDKEPESERNLISK